MKKEEIEARIKTLQSKLREMEKREERKKLHYQIMIIRLTILNNMTIEQLQKLAEKLKQDPQLLYEINNCLRKLV